MTRDAIEIIKTRRSIRNYKDRSIPKELLKNLIDAARYAPTARGIQPWEFVVITDSTTLKKIGQIAENGRFVSNARACIAVFCADTKYYLEDGCAATQNILLAATAQGLGSCWVAGDKKPYCSSISKILQVPETYRLVSLIALGYPEREDSFGVANRRSLNELIHWERF